MYEVGSLKCKGCGKEVNLIAFIKGAISVTKILTHHGEAVESTKMQRSRAPSEEVQVHQDFSCGPEPDYQINQILSW